MNKLKDNIVTVEDLSFRFVSESIPLFEKFSLTLKKGEFVVLTGPSGCGKTILCYCLCGIIPHILTGDMDGQVIVNGFNTRDHRLPVLAMQAGMVFQDPDTQLFFSCVEDEIAFAMENMCIHPDEMISRIDSLANKLSIKHLLKNNPLRLSGGEKYLVALAAVLALNPEFLIVDEIFPQLDPANKGEILELINNLCSDGKTVLAVEHEEAVWSMADRVITLGK